MDKDGEGKVPKLMTLNQNDSELLALERAALGKEPADIILSGGDVLNVYTGEILRQQVVIKGERIAYVGGDHDFPVSEHTQVFDVSGQVLIPGLIDAHCHMDFGLSFAEYTKYSLPRGTTTIITECPGAIALGIDGIRKLLKLFKDSPQRFYATAPVIALISSWRESQDAFSNEDMAELLNCPEILGLGEIYWSRYIDAEKPAGLSDLVLKAKQLGKTVEGHGAGAKNRKLAAMAAAGINSCHEPITAEDVRERLRLGLSTMIREGSIRRELEMVIKPLVDMGLDLRKGILVSDGVWPEFLLNNGHMDFIVRKAISLGLDPIRAIQMATLNAAEHFNLDKDLGSITPGKFADIVLVPDLNQLTAELVICRGRVVGAKGALTSPLAPDIYPEEFLNTVKLAEITPETFAVPAGPNGSPVLAMELLTDIVTRSITVYPDVRDGFLQANPWEDTLKVAVVDRFEATGRRAVGFIKGFGLTQGAVATSLSFDEENAVVIGCNDGDMAAALNRLRVLNGGLVYCRDGQVVEEVPLPVLGAISRVPGPELCAQLERFIASLRTAGCCRGNPLLTLITTTFTAIPSLRITLQGYWLSKENRHTGLFVTD